MIKISLKKRTLEIQETIEELTVSERIYAFGLLYDLFSGRIAPFNYQISMLTYLLGYKPSFVSFWQDLFHFIRGSKHYKAWISKKTEEREIINFNLLWLAEKIFIGFSLEENKIIPNYFFKDNPFLEMYPHACTFHRNISVESDMTAKEFSDALDYVIGMNNENTAVKEHCISKCASVLLRIPFADAEKLEFGIKYGCVCWFHGIYNFFRQHDTYSVIFNRQKKEGSDNNHKINLGMTEVILYLKKEGYIHSDSMNIIEFFDSQIKSLKDCIQKAIAEGVKIEKLSSVTGLSIIDINRLS